MHQGAKKLGEGAKGAADFGVDTVAGGAAGKVLLGAVLPFGVRSVVSPFTLRRTEQLAGRAASRSVTAITDSMKASGFVGDPVEVFRVRDELYIINGHHRVAAAKAAGIDIPIRELSLEEVQAYGYKSAEDVVTAWSETAPDKLR
jgi:hypothetical protein